LTTPYLKPYTLATKVGQKILVTKGVHGYSKPDNMQGLYKDGDILTVKKFSDSRFEYGTEYHIQEVEEFLTPEPVKVIILPGEYNVVRNCYECEPRKSERDSNMHWFLKEKFYCEHGTHLWEEVGIEPTEESYLEEQIERLSSHLEANKIRHERIGTSNEFKVTVGKLRVETAAVREERRYYVNDNKIPFKDLREALTNIPVEQKDIESLLETLGITKKMDSF
jgi:hypothetical protein